MTLIFDLVRFFDIRQALYDLIVSDPITDREGVLQNYLCVTLT